MKFAPIAPISWLDKFPSPDNYYLVLPHLLLDAAYFEFFANVDGYKILDNGEAEGQRDEENLIKYAGLINADEVVAPDVLGNYRMTIMALKRFSHQAQDHPEFKYGAVVQGSNRAEQVVCLRTIADEMDWITILYLPRHITNKSAWAGERANFWINHRQLLEDRFEAVHALGCSVFLEEPKYLSRYTNIRGIDTSLPFSEALMGRYLTEGAYVSRPKDYFGAELTDMREMASRRNMETFTQWCRYEALRPR